MHASQPHSVSQQITTKLQSKFTTVKTDEHELTMSLSENHHFGVDEDDVTEISKWGAWRLSKAFQCPRHPSSIQLSYKSSSKLGHWIQNYAFRFHLLQGPIVINSSVFPSCTSPHHLWGFDTFLICKLETQSEQLVFPSSLSAVSDLTFVSGVGVSFGVNST